MSALQRISETDKQVALLLIKAMIASDPIDRPPAQAIHNHPMFWDAAQILTFFQVTSCNILRFLFVIKLLIFLESSVAVAVMSLEYRSSRLR